MNSLDAQHISNNLHSYEAARSGFFSLIVDSSLQDALRASYNGLPESATDSDKIGAQAQEVLKLNVTKAPVPHFTLGVLEYKRGNDTVKFAGVPTFNSGNITIDDVVGMDTKSVLMAWQALAYNVHTRKGGRMKDYKKNCTLIEYTQDYEQIRQWDLFGCWISELSEGEFDKEQDGKRQITAKLEYDRAEMTLGPELLGQTTV